jgi:hypothetical protein
MDVVAERTQRRPLLPLADGLGIVLFATVGLLSHEQAHSVSGYARDALPVLGGWYAAALAFGAYRRPAARTLLRTWIVGVPLGIVVRGLVLGREPDGGQAVFLGIALAFTLLFVLAFRLALRAVGPSLLPERVEQRGVHRHREAEHDGQDDMTRGGEPGHGPAVDDGQEGEAKRRSGAQRRAG